MVDAISRKDAINALEQGFKDATNGLDKTSSTRGLIEAVTGIYKCYIGKLQPIQLESCWIPITERSPKALTYVLLTAYDGERQGVGYINTSGKWCYVNEGEVMKGCEPLAWMPLPEPYKR